MATISEDYVSFEVAKLLKDKGFNEPTIGTYNIESKNPILVERPIRAIHCEAIISAPTLQMAMKWLREVHDIDFDINTTGSRHVRRYHLAIWENKDEEMVTINPIGYFNKWEQACEAAIKYCLENLI